MSRKTVSFDADWKFNLGDHPGAALPDYSDIQWRDLDLPHDWSVEGKFERSNPAGGDGAYLPAGIGWYRKHFNKPEGPVTLLRFDGVYQKSDIWINGVSLGRHNYGYTGFEYDISPYLRDGDNILAVRVDNSEQPNSRWYTGSGIYRHVWLIQTEKCRVAEKGVFVLTPDTGEDKAVAVALIELTEPAAVTLAVLDHSGNVLTEQESPEAVVHEQMLTIDKPTLWSHENPVLYTLRTRVSKGGKLQDEVLTSFGIRYIRFDKDNGFSINGIRTKLNGVCIHQDGGSTGAAIPETVWVRRLKELKEMGCNAIRMAHNPPAPELLDLCDRMGFYVMDEAFDEWRIIKRKSDNNEVSYGYGQVFDKDAEKDLADMVRRDRNHPSVVIWSIGNEIPDQSHKDGWKDAKRLQDICHREDPTRLVTSACDNIKADQNRTTDEFIKTLDVLGINYVNRWRMHAETAYAWERYNYPDKIIIGTEHTGAGGVRGDYSMKAESGKWRAMPYFSRFIRVEHLLKQTMSNDFVCGDFMWSGIDYIGEARWPSKGYPGGVLDTCGFRKDGYYLYQSLWTPKPLIHLFPHWNWKGREGSVIPVLCCTNCSTVELFLNGRSLGTKCLEFPAQGMTETYGHFDLPVLPVTTNDLHLSWDVPYEPGVIRAVGRDRYGNVLVTEEVRTTGETAEIVLEPDLKAFSGKHEVAHCIIRIEDGEGNLVPTADDEVCLTIEGPAVLIGMDNGLPTDMTPMKSPVRRVLAGFALALVKTTGDQGVVTITANAPGLKPGKTVMEIRKV